MVSVGLSYNGVSWLMCPNPSYGTNVVYVMEPPSCSAIDRTFAPDYQNSVRMKWNADP